MREEILAYGHPNITAKHRTTMQVTKDEEITLRADCIIGVRASKSVAEISPELRRHLLEGGEISVSLMTGDMEFSFRAWGDHGLKLKHGSDAVVRRSAYIDDRTLAIRSTAAAKDLPRSMIRTLRNPSTVLVVEIVF